MSILAEPRRRRQQQQRIGSDPQNMAWKRDTDKFGQKMMERMGWSEGKGLGRTETGITENIRLRPNHEARGLGCDATTKDNVWMAHHDDFASILSQLNDKKKAGASAGDEKAAARPSIEEQSKNSRSRIHYKRFCQAKDLQQATDHQRSSIFGGNRQPQQQAVEDGCVEEQDEHPAPPQESPKTTVSKVSMSDYFAEKMRKRKHTAI